jgi:non-specific serine/threonine protein kinase
VAPLEAQRSNLPIQLTSFVGRETEIAEVKRLVGTTRLLTLTGPGGVGKTRLAQEVAADLLPDFPDGVWHVELAPLADPSLVPHTVAATLGIHEQLGRTMVETLTTILALRHLLLVLDNCEHLVSACAALCGELLGACSEVRVLATSRQALGTPGEITWPVPPMRVPDAGGGPLLTEAVQLFVARAVVARPSYTLTPQQAPLVGDICRRLDGIPLAIELAAARVKVLTVEQIAARLDDRFRLLTGGSLEVLPRHQTLRALVDWSYELLTEPERTLFRRLAVFARGCTLDAVEAVCADAGEESAVTSVSAEGERELLAPEAMLDLLARLVDRSLIVPEEAAGEMRYRLLETMRAYAWERLRESGEADAVRDRHLGWYRDLAVRSELEFVGPDEPAWLVLQRLEEANFRAALEWSKHKTGTVPDADRLEAGLTLAGALWRFWDMQGRLGEGRTWLDELLARPGAARPTLGRAKALFAAGYVELYQQGNFDRATMHWAESLRVARAFQPGHELVLGLWSMGIARMLRREPDAAEPYFDELGDVAREIGSTLGTVVTIFWQGQIALMRGDEELAVARALESLKLMQSTGDRWYAANGMLILGQMALARGDNDTAQAWFREVVDAMNDFRDTSWMLTGLLGLAWVASAQGEAGRAVRLMGGVEASNEAVGVPTVIPYFQATQDHAMERARADLGEEAFAAAWAAGRALSFTQLMEEALAEAALPGGEGQVELASAPAAALLSPREREVAALIARGLTNPQIADALVISRLTAGTHVRNILRKLGATSRAQVASWAVSQGLAPPPAVTEQPRPL